MSALDQPLNPVQPPEAIRRPMKEIENATALDRVVAALEPVAERAGAGRLGENLQGRWLGHALHPLLTDFPLGCWISAGLLDLVGGKSSRRAAQRLVGLGLAAVPPTMAAGLADFSTIGDQRVRRVGAVHGLGNVAVGTFYLMSWRARRRGQHARGVALGLTGGMLGWLTGYLGGHLSFGRGVGVGDRGVDDPLDVDPVRAAANDAVTMAYDGAGTS